MPKRCRTSPREKAEAITQDPSIRSQVQAARCIVRLTAGGSSSKTRGEEKAPSCSLTAPGEDRLTREDRRLMHKLDATERSYGKLPASLVQTLLELGVDQIDNSVLRCLDAHIYAFAKANQRIARKLLRPRPPVPSADNGEPARPKRPVILVLTHPQAHNAHAVNELVHDMLIDMKQGRSIKTPLVYPLQEFIDFARPGPSRLEPPALLHKTANARTNVINISEHHDTMLKALAADKKGKPASLPGKRRFDSTRDVARRLALEHFVMADTKGEKLFFITDSLPPRGSRHTLKIYKKHVNKIAGRQLLPVYLTSAQKRFKTCLVTKADLKRLG